jgi:ABC-2 type transport system permease protein
MSLRRTRAITVRLLQQFRHDHRTLGLLFVTPIIVLSLFAVLLRTDDQDLRVGLVSEAGDGLAGAIADAFAETDALVVVRVDSASEAEQQVRDEDLDAYVVIPAEADADGVLRPEIVVEGTDQRAFAAVPAALQASVMAAIGDLMGDVPEGAPIPSIPTLEPEVTPLFGDEDLDLLDLFGGPFIGLLVFFLVYVVTSVSFLRERTIGTLERLMASPLRRAEIIVGYSIGFMLLALVQSALVLVFALWALDLYNAGSVALLFGIVVLLALGAVNLGIFLSTFARNEFQAVQFIPLVIVPQILLSGLLVPVASEPEWLQVISNALPLTYAVEALREVMLRGADLGSSVVQVDLAVLGAFAALAIVAGVLTLRREVA